MLLSSPNLPIILLSLCTLLAGSAHAEANWYSTTKLMLWRGSAYLDENILFAIGEDFDRPIGGWANGKVFNAILPPDTPGTSHFMVKNGKERAKCLLQGAGLEGNDDRAITDFLFGTVAESPDKGKLIIKRCGCWKNKIVSCSINGDGKTGLVCERGLINKDESCRKSTKPIKP